MNAAPEDAPISAAAVAIQQPGVHVRSTSAHPAEVKLPADMIAARPLSVLVASRQSRSTVAGKRAVELLFVAPLAVVAAPMILLSILAILLVDRQVPFYRDERVGQGGRLFRCLKLRTMRSDPRILAAHFESHPEELRMYQCTRKLMNDPRVTWIGAFLRRSSIDELPQIYNILKGEMALVGPRPLAPSEFAERGPDGAPLTLVRPGVTGLWQVRGRSDTTLRRRIHLDNFYARRWSVALDIRIILETPIAVLKARGAR